MEYRECSRGRRLQATPVQGTQREVAEVKWLRLLLDRDVLRCGVHSHAQNVRGSVQDVLKCARC
jgi:hypothetical protein